MWIKIKAGLDSFRPRIILIRLSDLFYGRFELQYFYYEWIFGRVMILSNNLSNVEGYMSLIKFECLKSSRFF